jgi:hypothetical protein
VNTVQANTAIENYDVQAIVNELQQGGLLANFVNIRNFTHGTPNEMCCDPHWNALGQSRARDAFLAPTAATGYNPNSTTLSAPYGGVVCTLGQVCSLDFSKVGLANGQTGSYTATCTDTNVFFILFGGAATATLPSGCTTSGTSSKVLYITNWGGSSYNLTISGLASGATPLVKPGEVAVVVSQNGYWMVSPTNIGTMATQNANAVAVTGGTIDGATLGATTPSTGKFTTLSTATNCSSSASPAVCGSAAAGQVQIAAGATSIQINTTAVTANSRIGCLTYSTVGITAPTNIASLIQPYLSAVTAGTSFTLTVPVAPLTYPVNLQYCLIN